MRLKSRHRKCPSNVHARITNVPGSKSDDKLSVSCCNNCRSTSVHSALLVNCLNFSSMSRRCSSLRGDMSRTAAVGEPRPFLASRWSRFPRQGRGEYRGRTIGLRKLKVRFVEAEPVELGWWHLFLYELRVSYCKDCRFDSSCILYGRRIGRGDGVRWRGAVDLSDDRLRFTKGDILALFGEGESSWWSKSRGTEISKIAESSGSTGLRDGTHTLLARGV